MKDGRTRLAHKLEMGVDMESGAVAGVTVQTMDGGDTASLPVTLDEREARLAEVGAESKEVGRRQGLPLERDHDGREGAPLTVERPGSARVPKAAVAAACWRRAASTLVACAVGLTAAPSIAQPVVEVSGEVSCGECRITMDTILTFWGLDGPGSDFVEGPVPLAAVDQRGRILLTHFARNDIAVFDSAGQFIGEVGGGGEGPGEYAFITHLNVGPEFIHVFDGVRGRTLLDADHSFVRRDRFQANVTSATVTESGTVVFAGDVQSSGSVGHKLHLVGSDGNLQSYGWDGSVYRGPSGQQFAVAANDSWAWIVDGASGRIEEWALLPEAKLSRIVNRSVGEFDREKAATTEGAFIWPTADNFGARLDDHGLWVLWWGPDRGWTKRTSDPEVAAEWDGEASWQAIFDGVLDLIDPETGRTLARYRSDLPMPGFVYGSDMVIAYEETQEGVPRLHLLRPTVHGVSARREWP